MICESILMEYFKNYSDELKPLLATVEAKLEIRAIYDHTARVAIYEMEEKDRQEELKKIERHLHRAKLDCYKTLCIFGEINADSFEDNYRNISLGDVDSGKFYPKYLELKNVAREKVIKAKSNEKAITSNEHEVSRLYQEAVIAYDDFEKFISSNFKEIEWTVQFLRKYSKKGYIIAIIIAFVLGIITTILGSIIGKYLHLI